MRVKYDVSSGNSNITTENGPRDVNITHRKKRRMDVYLLAIILGIFGAHHFYLRRRFFGFTYLFTCGLFGIGYVVDLIRMKSLVNDEFDRRQNPELEKKKSLFDAYLLWFPLGIFGLHYFFLHKKYKKWAVLYLLTGGMFGIGWLIDLYRMPFLVKHANDDHEREFKPTLSTTYVLALSPFGPFGAHHFYLRRNKWGWLYVFTFGLFGIGWIVDLFRLKKLVKRVLQEETGQKKVHLDDAYMLWLFPLGLFGGHHFYLHRNGWGWLYFCTLGMFAVGWLIDIIRLPRLVKDLNALIKQQNELDSLPSNRRSVILSEHPSTDISSYEKCPGQQVVAICDYLAKNCSCCEGYAEEPSASGIRRNGNTTEPIDIVL